VNLEPFRKIYFYFCRLLNNCFQNPVYIASYDECVTPNLEESVRKRPWPTLSYYPDVFPQGLRKTTKELGTKGVPAEVQNKHLRNTS